MKTTRVMLVSFATNLFLIVFKTIFGIIGSSSALLADGMHSFSDVISDLFALVGVKISNKPADLKHPYGHGKLEYLISLAMGTLIFLLGINIIKSSIKKEIIVPSIFVSLVSLITIIIKLLLSNYIIKNGKRLNNNILISSGYESRSDVISSFVVILSIILMNLSSKIYIFKYADIVATILVGLIIIKIGISIVIDNISVLLEEQVLDDDLRKEIETIFYSEPKLYSVDSLIILKFGPYSKLIANVSMDKDLSLLDVYNKMKYLGDKIKEVNKIKYYTIHVDPYIEK